MHQGETQVDGLQGKLQGLLVLLCHCISFIHSRQKVKVNSSSQSQPQKVKVSSSSQSQLQKVKVNNSSQSNYKKLKSTAKKSKSTAAAKVNCRKVKVNSSSQSQVKVNQSHEVKVKSVNQGVTSIILRNLFYAYHSYIICYCLL